MEDIYTLFTTDDEIMNAAAGRIKYHEYPPVASVDGIHIILDPILDDDPTDYADDTPMYEESLCQIDVWSKNRLSTKDIDSRIKDLLLDNNYRHAGSMKPEYDSDTGIYRRARRFAIKKLIENGVN